MGHLALTFKDEESPFDEKTARKLGLRLEHLNHHELKDKFPFLAPGKSREGIFMPEKSGYVNPRQMLKAQKLLAQKRSCDVIDDVVKRVTPIGSGGFEVEAERSGHVITGRKVLVATGCFTHSRQLLPVGKQLDIKVDGTTVLLVCCRGGGIIPPDFEQK